MTRPAFEAVVRGPYHPMLTDRHYWLAGTKRQGATRPGRLCRHEHATFSDAEACAARQLREREDRTR